MPTCAGCTATFPNRIKINGKWHNLASRKFCLTCSPFGRHNTRNLTVAKAPVEGTTRVCEQCNKEFVVDRKRGNHGKVCNVCNVYNRRKRLKAEIIAYKGGRCVVCGYNRTSSALHFHHLDPVQKDFEVSKMVAALNLRQIKEEADKCVLLCANCHVEVHEGLVNLSLGSVAKW